MTTNQENIIATIETQLGLSGLNYNEAIMQLATNTGITATDINSMLAQYLALATGSTETNINGLLSAYATLYFDGNINAINSLTAGEFTFTIKTDNAGTSNTDQFTFPLVSSGTYDFTAYASDGTVFSCNDYTANTMTFGGGAGTLTVRVVGTFTGLSFNNGGDKLKFLNIAQWGIFDFGNVAGAFFGCSNLTITATDKPGLTGTTDFSNNFRVTPLILDIYGIAAWDWSTVTNLFATFFGSGFGSSLDGANFDSLTNLNYTFYSSNFNSLIGQDQVGGRLPLVTNMGSTYQLASSFNQNLGVYNIESVTSIANLASGAGLSTANYDLTLVSWAGQTVNSGLTPDFGSAKYTGFSTAGTAHTKLINELGWTITDGVAELPATTGLWLDSYDEVTIFEAAGSVSQWSDKSASANNATQGTATNQPTTGTRAQNTRNVIDFTTNDTLQLSSKDIFDQPFTMFVVAQTDTDSSNMSIISRQLGGTDGGFNLRNLGTGTFQAFAVGAGTTFSVTAATSNTNANLHAITFDLTAKYYFNGNDTPSIGGTLTSYDNAITTAAMIGSVSGVNFLDGFVAEIIILKSVASASVINDIEAYLNEKWSIY